VFRLRNRITVSVADMRINSGAMSTSRYGRQRLRDAASSCKRDP
jgi:hypothetical protein